MVAKRVFVVASLYSLSLLLSVVQAQLSTVNITEVMESLSRRFQEIRNDGLGIDRLEDAYRNAQFDFNTLTPAQIETLISDTATSISDSVTSVTTLFDNVESDMFPNRNITPTDCCLTSGSNACCYQCDAVPPGESDMVDRIAGLFSEYNLPDGGRLFYGLQSGSLVTHPPVVTNCTEQDSRLQQWYRSSHQRPLEVVLVVDLSNPNPTFYGNDSIDALRATASEILNSLTQQDRVALVRADFASPLPLIISRLATSLQDLETVPVCDDTLVEMEQFVTSVSGIPARDVNLTNALLEGVGLFSNDSNTEKILVSLLPGLSATTSNIVSAGTVAALEAAIAARGTDIFVSSYRGIDALGQANSHYSMLAEAGFGSGNNFVLLPRSGPLVSIAGSFYEPFLNSASAATTIGSGLGASGGSVLTVSRPVINGTGYLLGVLHAELPWEHILSSALAELAGRDSSYVFVVANDNNLLSHPFLPARLLSDIPVSRVESDIDIGLVLSSASPGTTQSAALTKTLLVPTTSSGLLGFVVRRVPSRYHCRRTDMMSVCLLLADEDLSMASLSQQSVNVEGTYSSSPSRLPLYHNLMLSAPDTSTCDYFCKATVTDRISFQLTTPSQPARADDPSLVQEVSSYIAGTGPRPSWAEEGVAEDINLGSAVASNWTDDSPAVNDYISRRHLATPSGAYLTYPPTQFVSEYHPRNTAWYTAAQAHPSLLTLTPPQNTLTEGSKLTVSVGYAVKTPSSESDTTLNGTQTLSVVAADLTLDTLRVFVREALPLCDQNNQVSCLIIDDLGNIIYDDVVVRSTRYNGGAWFFGTDFEGNDFEERKTLIATLLSQTGDVLLSKRECEDYSIIGVDTLRFFSLDVTYDGPVSGSDRDNCLYYLIQRIPGTNAFMVVLQERQQCTPFCFCSRGDFPQCLVCNSFSANGCECPCFCRGECHTRTPPITLACPLREVIPVNQEVAAQTESPEQGACFNQACNCRATYDSCLGVRECNWCSAQQRCVYNTECCDPSTVDCCFSSLQFSRFSSLSCNLRPVCEAGTHLTATCPTSAPNTAIIAAGVVGGLFAALLLVFIVVLFIWYQFCRREDPKDEHSRESAFDFSKKTEATNPVAVTGSDVVSDDGINKSAVSSQAPLVDGGQNEKTDSTTL